MVAEATSVIIRDSSRFHLPPIANRRQLSPTSANNKFHIRNKKLYLNSNSKNHSTKKELSPFGPSSPTKSNHFPLPFINSKMGTRDTDSQSSESDSNYTSIKPNRTIFICGFVSKRWHNSSLQVVIHDLLPHYYVACNGENWHNGTICRDLLSNADALLFFVNEFTLRDNNCLLTLQYAWNLMVPIIMLRPPRTKLVICKRDDRRDDIMVVSNGSIMRSPSTRWALMEETAINSVDYNLLQDVLYEGYKMSVVYDRLEHRKSMNKVHERLEKVLQPTVLASHGPMNVEKPAFFLSPSNNSSTNLTVRSDRIATRHSTKRSQPENIRLSQSMINLSAANGRKTVKRESNRRRKEKVPPLVADPGDAVFDEEVDTRNQTGSERDSKSSNTTTSDEKTIQKTCSIDSKSRTSSIERRMSMSSLDDISGYQQTQYLVFPLSDATKKPTLVKFPEDLLEEQYKEGSVWGSDTSLEEEAAIATKVTSAISIDLDEPSSPIMSPAPYIDPI